MTEQKYRTQLYLDEEQYRFLKEQSARHGISMAGVVRSLIDREIVKGQEVPEDDPIFHLGREDFATGCRNGSTNHDLYIYGQAKEQPGKRKVTRFDG